MNKKRILSGIQSTGNLTLGNYLGAIHNWIDLQEKYDCNYMIANLHTLTVRTNPDELRKNILNLIAIYIAAGLDPEKNNIFIQSQISAHSELAWILNCYTYMGELSRMTQFKDKSEKHADNINAGLFTYPVLMAADILLYQADLVPVGEDQRQHLEITRDIAERFNKLYGETFVVPEGYVSKAGAKIMGLQNPENKMSKSAENKNDVIFLNDSPDEIMRKFKKAVTDSDGIVKYDINRKPGISNLMTIYGTIKKMNKEDVEKEFQGIGYGKFKQAVAEVVIEELKPIQDRYKDIIKKQVNIQKICKNGIERAELIANKSLYDVHIKIGLIL